MQLAVTIYGLTREFPREGLNGLTSQMRRSVVSISSNIAECQGRINAGECKQFLGIAHVSSYEVQTQLELARELRLGDPKTIDSAENLSHQVGKMIYALLESLEVVRAPSTEN